MDEAPATGSGAARRNEDIALDLMKFVAMTTGYGKTASSGGVGFTGGGFRRETRGLRRALARADGSGRRVGEEITLSPARTQQKKNRG